MKKIYVNEEVNKIILDESGIIGFSWTGEEETNFEIQIDWNGQSDLKEEFDFTKIKTKLVFIWVTNLKMNLDWRNYIQSPVITIFSFKKEPHNTFSINFELDFNALGYICFNCNDFYFEIIE